MQCPQCKDFIEDSSKRIIKDSCGHEKCRVCLLQDVERCLQCEEIEKNVLNLPNISSDNKNVRIETNNHTTVITCSKVFNTKEEVCLDNKEGKVSNDNQNQPNNNGKQVCNRISEKPKLRLSSQKRSYEIITMPNHITIEGTPPTFICNVCNSKFKTKGHVKYHKFCLGEKKPYVCEVCNKSFVLKSQLIVHENIHSGNKPYSCKVCEKSFRESGKLKRHMILHSDAKPHICDECGKNFKTLNSLKLHRVIHTGQKPYSCKYCKMRFNNSSNLKKHILSHSDDKTHMCEQCGKKFKQKWALTVHRRSHINKRDYICEICEKAFMNNKDLKRHETVHLDIKIYSCGICSMSFRRKDNLSRHFKNAHPDKKPEIIKRDVEPPDKLKKTVVDNPNAINVITSSPMTKKNEELNARTTISRTCMNGPLKLAFKTSAFKKNYNINRDHPYDSSLREVAKKDDQVLKSAILPTHLNSPIFPSSAFSVDEYYANRPHVIKNIKFKIPTNYPPENETLIKTIMRQSYLCSGEEKKDAGKKSGDPIEGSTDSIANKKNEEVPVDHQEVKDVNVGVTSVIVTSSDQKNMHWRRKMSQNIA